MTVIERRTSFKKNLLDGRRRRLETARRVRKSRKDEMHWKRRMVASSTNSRNFMRNPSSPAPNMTFAVVEDIPQFAQILKNPASPRQQIQDAVRGFRRLLSIEEKTPVEAVLQSDVLPILIELLTKDLQAYSLIFEAAWALTNITFTKKARAVLDGGAVPILIQLLRHHVCDIREQAAWCLGNISGDHIEFRDIILQQGALEPLLMNIQEPGSMSLLSIVTWTVSNLCRSQPYSPAFELVAPAIQSFADLLKKDVPNELLVDATWALSYLSEGSNFECIEVFVSTGVVETLVDFLDGHYSSLLTPTVRCLGNFVAGSVEQQTQILINAGLLDNLAKLLDSDNKKIRKKSCWLLSNFTAGTQDHIGLVMKNRDILQSLINNAYNSTWDVRKEAIRALSNICTSGNDIQVIGLVECEGLRPLVDILALVSADVSLLVAALDAIDQVLAIGARHDREYGTLVEEYNGIDYIEQIQGHPSNAVYKKSIKIIDSYFDANNQDDENLAPQVAGSGTHEIIWSSPKNISQG